MSGYLKEHGGSRVTSQSEPMRSDQVENSAGGFVWEADIWTRLRRFLILGSEGGSYYATERQLTLENVRCLRDCIAEDGIRVVKEAVDVSDRGLAPSNEPALYALAAAISCQDRETRSAAAEALPSVARIGTHLYSFVAYAETMRGWGRTLRWAVSNWYEKNPSQLAYQAVKYRQRNGWSHRDLLRLAHPEQFDATRREVLGFISGNKDHRVFFNEQYSDFTHAVEPWSYREGSPHIEGFLKAQQSQSASESAALVKQYNLPREALLTEHQSTPEVWRALLESDMPIMAMTRNLANMTRVGVLASSEYRQMVVGALADQEAIAKSRIHPMALLLAQGTYAAGRGVRGSNVWAPIPDIIDALDAAFYLAFGNVPSTGKRLLLAVDVSGSMDSHFIAETRLTAREAAAAMALVTLHAEPNVELVGFHSGPGGVDFGLNARWGRSHGLHDGLTPLSISRRQRLDDVVGYMSRLEMGGTDCSLPFRYATKLDKEYDGFVVYTDNETWHGEIHPKQALDQYRQQSGINARSAVVGMVANRFTIADPADSGMMDFVGFDSSAPTVMAEFLAGNLS